MTTDVSQATPRIAVIIPCKNEALTIAKVITDFHHELPDAKIWVCDNRSTDETAATARAAGALVVEEDRPGKGHAVRRLFAAANADIYVLVDGDATYDPKSIHRMVDCLESDRLDRIRDTVSAVRERLGAGGVLLYRNLRDGNKEPDEGALGPADAVNIWRGALITAERTFRPEDDVCKGQREPSDPSSTPGALAKVLDPIVRP